MQTGPEFLLSVSSYKGILYLENLGGVQLKEPPCRTAPATPGLLNTLYAGGEVLFGEMEESIPESWPRGSPMATCTGRLVRRLGHKIEFGGP